MGKITLLGVENVTIWNTTRLWGKLIGAFGWETFGGDDVVAVVHFPSMGYAHNPHSRLYTQRWGRPRGADTLYKIKNNWTGLF